MTRIPILSLVLALLPVAASAAEMAPALTQADLAPEHSAAFADGKPMGAAPAGVLAPLLGITPPGAALPSWKVGPVVAATIDFRVAFKGPVAIGTIFTSFAGGATAAMPIPRGGQSVSILKPDAPYPGDVTKEDEWTVLPAGAIKTLPPGTTTRALRFHERAGEWGYGSGGDRAQSSLPYTILLKERYYNALNLGHFSRTGKPGTTEVWMGYWTEKRPVVGIVFMPLATASAHVGFLDPDFTEHPILAVTHDWKSAPDVAAAPGASIYRFDAPVDTRAIRLIAPSFQQQGSFPQVFPLINLGSAIDVPGLAFPPPPFVFKYTMPMDGFVAINILDKNGKRVRRLIAEVERKKGPVEEPWDLRDDKGALVPPGDYTIKAIARPPLKLTYELTAYNAGQPAWWAPPPGKGGGQWMADHTPPYVACASKDLIFLASQVNESGDGVIAVDHNGNKVWGETSISGFDIADRLATDGRYVYVLNGETFQRIDPENKFALDTLTNWQYSPELPPTAGRTPTAGGLAARDGKAYVAFSGPPVSWLQSTITPDVLSSENSFPRVWLAQGGGVRKGFEDPDPHYGQADYDELMAFYEAFLTGSTPADTKTWPSQALPSSTRAYFGDAPKEGPMSGNLIASFSKPVTIGSIMLPDAGMKVWALKPGAPLPTADPNAVGGDPDAALGGDTTTAGAGLDDENWTLIPATGKPGHPGIALAPAGGLQTTALRFKTGRLAFAMAMNHRFDDLAPDSERVFSEGGADKSGAWAFSRPSTQVMSKYNPASMALVWKEPVSLRGISLIRPTASAMLVDVYTGPAGSDPKAALANDKMWRQVGRIDTEIFHGYFPQMASVRNVDFGEEVNTRAVRLRALAPFGTKDVVGGPWPAGTDVLSAIVAEHHLGDDPSGLPPELGQRITELQLPTDPKGAATIIRQIPFKSPGYLLFNKSGVLYAVSDGQIVTVPLDGKGQPKVVIHRDLLEQPGAIAFDADGLLYVADLGPQVVKVFNVETGKLVRTIGRPGGHKPGPWNPNYMDNPTGITIDSAGKLWVAHNSYQPKLVDRWSREGVPELSFMGPTQYGGGGTMDEEDRSIINYNGMKFRIDWTKMDWKLESILYRPGPGMSLHTAMPDHPVYYKGHRYLVGNGGGGWTPVPQVICVERNDIAVPMAAAGNLGTWADVGERPDLLKAFGNLDRQKYGFVWVDKNGDGIPQASEVQIAEGVLPTSTGMVGEDLSFGFDGARLRPTGFLANGVPNYNLSQLEKLPLMSSRGWAATDGRTFTMVDQYDRMIAPSGKSATWDYWDEFGIFAGFYVSGYGYDRPPGVLNAEQSIFGHLKNVGPNHEEYWITSSDQGDWFCFTNDGMLVGCIFGGPTGYGLRRWTMPDWTPGKVDLSDLRLLQECYQGDVVRANDGNVYAVAGKNHMSVVKVDGLDKLQRLAGTIVVKPDDVPKAQAWSIRKAAMENAREDAKIAKVPYVHAPFTVDGSLDDWPDDLFFNVHQRRQLGLHVDQIVPVLDAALAFDDDNLYIAAKAGDNARMSNSAENLETLFKKGDALDIQLGLNPNADPKRTGPVPGDIRLLLSQVKGKLVAEIYRYKVPNADPQKIVKFTSPVGETDVDAVETLTDVQLGINMVKGGWTMEAAIPWKDLGVDPLKVGTKIRGDIGMLQSDQNGVATVSRIYWSGKSQKVVSDLPSEARLAPSLWGDLYFTAPEENMKFGPDDTGGGPGGDGGLEP